ncbi:hypothetical protein MRBLMS1_004748 [Massilia sp. LMS1-1-1.1]
MKITELQEIAVAAAMPRTLDAKEKITSFTKKYSFNIDDVKIQKRRLSRPMIQ